MSAIDSYNKPVMGRESKAAYFEHLFQSVPAGVVLLDRGDCVIDFNQWFTDLFGYVIEEARGKKINDLIVPQELKGEGEQATKDVAAGQSITLETIRKNKDGQLLYVSISGQPFNIHQGEVAVIAVYQDVTDRKHAEESLRESEEKLRTIFHHANIGFSITDKSGKFTLNNKRHADFLGYPLSELQQKTIQDITHPDDYAKTADYLARLVQNEINSYRIEKRYIRRDGQVVWGDVSVSSTKDKDGQVKMIIAMIKDITEKKQAEVSLQKSEQRLRELNATKDTLLSILSHDLRSPFTSILGFANILLEDIAHADKDTLLEHASVIRDQADNTLTLLNDILSWAMVQSGKMPIQPTPVNFKPVCQDVLEGLYPLAAEKNIQVLCAEMEDLVVYADLNMLQAVLRNLISNAIKFTPGKGEIKMTAIRDQQHAKVTVSDNGVGIEPDDIHKIWDLSSPHTTEGTAGETGSGYGLVLCKELLEKQGGQIWVESTPGKGSDFIFTLPLA